MRAKTITAVLAAFVVALVLAIPAQAAQTISSYDLSTSTTEAGGHPDIEASFTLDNPGQPEAAKDVSVKLPEGLFGNPDYIGVCTSADFALNQCPISTQAGIIVLHANYGGDPNYPLGTAPLYNIEARGDFETARLAFVAPTVDIPINVPLTVRTGSDYGITMTVTGITQEIPLASADVTVWGFPADQIHDVQRFHRGSPGSPAGCPGITNTGCIISPFPKAGIPVGPYVDNPTVCTGAPLTATLNVTTYQDPDNPSQRTAQFPATTGCEKETFNPVLNLALTTNEADSAAGLDIQLLSPIFLGLSNSPTELRSASVTLPQGLSINPDAADGQLACTDAQANLTNDAPAACPDNSKIGTFELKTPALPGSLPGALYFGEPKPGDQYRVIMVANGFGVHAKLTASVVPDPQTGQVTMSIEDLPQVPFDEFDIHLFASDRGLVATPTRCTIYRAQSTFTPWNDQLSPQQSSPFLSIDSGPNGTPCPGTHRPFTPRLVAGSSNPIAGDFTDFRLKLDRDDGDQFLGDLNFKLPPGFTGSLKGISYCPEGAITHAAQNLGRTEQAIPSCPASSQIGTTNVAAGPGSHPFHAVGKMYLAGPFKGAPLSLAAVTPALAGPYDYGTVVVRVALHVDPLDAHVEAVSDTVPSIIGGVPIRMRSIQVNIDKPNFTINPTNCSPFTVDSQGIGDEGTVADFSSYFQVVNCAALPFKPKMTFTQVSGGSKRSSNPSFRIDLNTRPGDANIKSVAVTLSNAFQIDQRHLGNICSETELVTKQCAGRQAIGMASTTTPLLDQPLSGPVYAVSGSGKLPRLAFLLNGQVNLDPRADATTVKGGRLQTTVPVVPDAPIGHFRFTLFGGKQGYLANTRDICAKTPISRVSYVAQNGATLNQKLPLKASCGNARKHAKHKRHHG